MLQNRVLSLGYLGDENQHLCMFMDVYKDLYSTMMYYFFEMNTQLPAILGRTLIRSKATSLHHPPSILAPEKFPTSSRRQELETQLQRQQEEEDRRNVEVLGRFKVTCQCPRFAH